MGSIHYLPSGTPLPSEFDECFEGAEAVGFESNLSRERNLELGNLRGTTLTEILSPSLLSKLYRVADELGVDGKNFLRIQPWAVVSDLTPHWIRILRADIAAGVDRVYLKRATDASKAVHFLEDIDYIPRMMNKENRQIQVDFLQQFLDEVESGRAPYEDMVDAWGRGDWQAFEAIAQSKNESSPPLMKLLLDRRNRNWLARIRDCRRSKRFVLFVVGCLHLVGTGNLRQLLAASGAEFEQL